MDALYALLLGVIEGLTEFLPISSTGHVIIAENYIHFKDTAKIFTVVIQIGAIMAVVWYYRKDIAEKISGLFGHQKQAVQFWINLVIATIPACIAGLILDKSFEKYATPGVVATALILGGIVLWLVDNKPAPAKAEPIKLNEVTRKQAITVGLAQCLSLIPGVSRSGSSIVGGLLSGLNRPTATTFSFYLGIPILTLASAYKLLKDFDQIGNISGGGISIVIGIVASFITGLIAVSWLLRYVSTHNFRIFAYYRILLGLLVLILLM
jgi:undecaprenyl-diphosphatase